jgi:hypothetical protein
VVRKFGVSLNALYFGHVAGNTIAFAIDAAYCDWARGWLAGCALNVARQAFGIIKCGRRFNVVMRGMAGQAVESTVGPTFFVAFAECECGRLKSDSACVKRGC